MPRSAFDRRLQPLRQPRALRVRPGVPGRLHDRRLHLLRPALARLRLRRQLGLCGRRRRWRGLGRHSERLVVPLDAELAGPDDLDRLDKEGDARPAPEARVLRGRSAQSPAQMTGQRARTFPIPPWPLAPSHLLSAYTHPSASVHGSSPSAPPSPSAARSPSSRSRLGSFSPFGDTAADASTLPARILLPAAFRMRPALAAAALSSFALGRGRSTRCAPPAPSRRTTTRHSGSSQRQRAVRRTRLPDPSPAGVYAVVGAGSANADGGAAGWCAAEHHEGRSFGRSAAVQSSPTHHRWFSYTVKRKRSDVAGGTSGSLADREEMAGWACEGRASMGRGAPERRDQRW